MPRSMVVLAAALLPAPALAGETATNPFTVDPGVLFQAEPGTVTENTIGRAAVAYDSVDAQYVMFFESKLPEKFYDPSKYAGCAQGVWGVNRATSPDGLHWQVDPEPVILPQPGTYYSCVVAHPNVIFDGQEYHLWFKTEQPASICDGGGAAPSWGCDQYTGIGQATSFDGLHWTFTTKPILTMDQFDMSDLLALGYPTVTRIDQHWFMLLAKQYDDLSVKMLLASSDDDARTWHVSTKPVFEPSGADWIANQVYNPALLCEDDPAKLQLTLFFAGKNNASTHVGFGEADADDPRHWFVRDGSPYMDWDTSAGEEPWIHWTAMRVGEDDYVVYYTDHAADGTPRMRVAYTSAEWDPAQTASRICPEPTWQSVDTGNAGETGFIDEDSDSDSTTCDVDVNGTWGCGGHGHAESALVLLPFAGLLVRRRRADR